MGEKYFQESDLRIWAKKMFLLGGCRPPDPLQLLLGGFQPPRPPGGGLAAPRTPLHTERLRLSGSPFFLGTKIIGPARTLATKISEFWTCPNPCDKDFRILDFWISRFPDISNLAWVGPGLGLGWARSSAVLGRGGGRRDWNLEISENLAPKAQARPDPGQI